MTFKILSLDGGGFRGVITGRILQLVESVIGFNPKNEKERHVKDAIARFIELDGLPDISS